MGREEILGEIGTDELIIGCGRIVALTCITSYFFETFLLAGRPVTRLREHRLKLSAPRRLVPVQEAMVRFVPPRIRPRVRVMR
jgi:hypothetical protein